MPADPWPLQSHLELGALPTAVPCARLHARQMLWEWGLDGLSETAELLVSELVTNAVKATAGQDLPLPVRLRLSSDKDRLLIEVWDADPRPPVLPGLADDGTPAPADEGGRGLFLVATLSHRWNWYAPREWGGKVVWSELQLSAGHRRDQHGTDHLREGRSVTRDEQPRIAQQSGVPAGGRQRAGTCPGQRTRHGAAAQAPAGRGGGRHAPGTGRPGDPAAGQDSPDQALSGGARAGRKAPRNGKALPAGVTTRTGSRRCWPGLTRRSGRRSPRSSSCTANFAAWAVWLPHRGRRWTAVRPALSRAPGPDLPMVWIHAATGAQPADQMRDVNAQLTGP